MAETQGNGKRNGNMRRRLYRWHRLLGLVASVLVLILAVTGPVLTHADALGLHDHWVKSDILLAIYDPRPAKPPQGVETPAGWVVEVDGMLILEDRALARDAGALLGAAGTERFVAVATRNSVFLLTPDGTLIERLQNGALPGRIERAGKRDDRLIIKTAAGTYRAGKDFLSWSETATGNVTWLSAEASLDKAVAAQAVATYRRHTVSLHRLIADIHSGRIVGSWGPYVMDAAAVMLLVLIGTGLVNWRGTRRRR